MEYDVGKAFELLNEKLDMLLAKAYPELKKKEEEEKK